MWDAKTKTLFHRWRDGERDNVQLLEGYAFLLAGVIDLYEATLEPKHLDFAIALADAMLAKFYDAENGGFWQSAADAHGSDLAREGRLRRRGAFRKFRRDAGAAETRRDHRTRKILNSRRKNVASVRGTGCKIIPQALPFMLQALDFSLEEPRRVVIAGDVKSNKFSRIVPCRAFGLSTEQNCSRQHRRRRAIRKNSFRERRSDRFRLHRQCLPAAD